VSDRLLGTLRGSAPRLCAARGLACPRVLLGDGLPEAGDDGDAVAAPRDLDGFVKAWLEEHPDRRRAGLYLTPRGAARALLREVAADGFRPRAICDPAVGAGVFLEEAISLFGPNVHVWGIDSDPLAVAFSRLAVWLAGSAHAPDEIARRIRWGDSLLNPEPWGGPIAGFDLVCGNPPFGNAIERRTARSVAERRILRAAFPETARGPYDRSTLFVDLARRLLSPGGRYALLIPRALLSARYASGLREMLAREAPITRLVLYPRDAPVPGCAIAMAGWIGTRSAQTVPDSSVLVQRADGETVRSIARDELDAGSWGALCDPDRQRSTRGVRRHPAFADFFEVTASATVSEAYSVAASIRDRRETDPDGSGWPFLTVRLITRYRDRWGRVPGRFLGRTFTRPFLPRDAPGLAARRASLYDRPKIVIAGLSRDVKAIRDIAGRYAGSVGTLSAVPRTDDPAAAERFLRRGALLVNSGWISAIHRGRRGPLSLAGGSIPLGRRDVAEFPFPIALAGEGAAPDGAALRAFLLEPERSIPDDPDMAVGILDAAASVLLDSDGADPVAFEAWDRLVQRVFDSRAFAH